MDNAYKERVKLQSTDPGSQRMIDRALADGVSTVFDRVRTMKPCPIGSEGNCCRICSMGPCRLTKEGSRGVCGATLATITARNWARMVAVGTAAHADHARRISELFLVTALGKAKDLQIRDEDKLIRLATALGIEVNDRAVHEIAIQLGQLVLAQFSRQHGELEFCKFAPKARQEKWRKFGLIPRGIDREVVELLHRTHMGVDQDYRNLLLAAARCSLADGWGGSMIASELQDILFGTPKPTFGQIGLGVLRADMVNILVHGHEPTLAEMLVKASRLPAVNEAAERVGAKGINLAGLCCTGSEVLNRHGIPHAGNFLMQELAIVTGAVEVMVLDVQCEMQSLAEIAKCYHTRLLTTSNKARIEEVQHLAFSERRGLEIAQEIIALAIDNFANRTRVEIPPEKSSAIVGFSPEAIAAHLGAGGKPTLAPLAEAIRQGVIRGVAGVVGCNNARVTHNSVHGTLVRELIRHDVLVLSTGCAAVAFGTMGLLGLEAAEQAGPGLRAVCRQIGIPPVLQMGACVDNSRILQAANALLAEGGLGNDLSHLPVVGAAPEWMSEKALAIGQYFVASGIFTVFGVAWPTHGSEVTSRFLFRESERLLGGSFLFERRSELMAKAMLQRIEDRRQALGLDFIPPQLQQVRSVTHPDYLELAPIERRIPTSPMLKLAELLDLMSSYEKHITEFALAVLRLGNELPPVAEQKLVETVRGKSVLVPWNELAKYLERITDPEQLREKVFAALRDRQRVLLDLARFLRQTLSTEPIDSLFLGWVKNGGPMERAFSLLVLADLGYTPARELLQEQFDGYPRNLRWGILTLLHQTNDPQWLNLFMASLADPEQEVIRVALQALGNSGAPTVSAKLIEMLSQESEAVVVAALRAMAGLRHTETLSAAIALAQKTHSNRVLATVISTLGAFPDRETIPFLVKHLSHRDARVRANTVLTLKKMFLALDLEDESVIRQIIPLLDDPENRVRADAIQCLWELGHMESLDRIEEMLHDADPNTRASAAYLCGKLSLLPMQDELIALTTDSSWQVRKAAAQALVSLGTAGLNALRELMEHGEPDQQICAAFTMGLASDHAAIEKLINAARDKGNLSEIVIDLLLRLSDSPRPPNSRLG